MKMIDRNSGRGCAWTMAALKLADTLLEDGILNQPIVRKENQKHGDIVCYFDSSGCYNRASNKWIAGRPENEELWFPSFIEPEIWGTAAASFQLFYDLKYNLEYHLLPKMAEYVHDVSDEELNILLRRYLVDAGIINSPVRQIAGDTYFFNDNEIYTLDKGSKVFAYEGRLKFKLFKIRGYTSFNMNIWSKAVKHFKAGMSLTDCIKIFLDTTLEYKPTVDLPYLDRLIQHINAPEYERIPENSNAATFDRIRVFVGLPQFMFQSWDELKKAVQENRVEIDRRVLEKIESDRQFKKYGIPINFISLSTVLLRHNYSLEYIFELRDQRDE